MGRPFLFLWQRINIRRQLNNPVGGLGLTTGLLDAAHLAGSLRQVLNEGASTEVLLISYAETRRRIFRESTDPMSTANLLRLQSQKPRRH